MGANHSVGADNNTHSETDEEEEENDDELGKEEEETLTIPNTTQLQTATTTTRLLKKVLEQEPEILPCHASASPLSPQLSSLGTPRLGPSIKVWDPYNVLSPPPPPPSLSPPLFLIDDAVTDVFLITHGECDLNLRPDLVRGRCHVACLTGNGSRQARALAVLLKSNGVRFNAAYSSPLDRARSTAVSVCQEMNFSLEQMQISDALTEMSLGQWEGCPHSEIYTPGVLNLVESSQPDFASPSGESLRQVEYRMIQFLNETVLGLPGKLRSDLSLHQQSDNQVYCYDRDDPSLPPQWDALNRHRPGLSRKTSGKSRLQFVTSTGNHEVEDFSPREANHQNSLHDLNISSSSSVSSCVGVFTHSIPIKCLLTGILGCSAVMSRKICIEDSSVTVLQHSWKTGWQIKSLNDSAHLRLL